MFLRKAWLLLLLPVAPVVACFACSDGAISPSPADAAVDAVADAQRPRPDAAPSDAAEDPDAFVIDRSWLSGDWDLPPNPPPRCDRLIARTPARDVPSLTWKACDSARAQCRLADVTWSTARGYTFGTASKEPVRLDPNGTPYIAYFRVTPRTDQPYWPLHSIQVVEQMDGPVVFAEAAPLTPGSQCGSQVQTSTRGIVHTLFSSVLKVDRYRSSNWATLASFAEAFVPLAATIGAPGGTIAGADSSIVLTDDPEGWVLVNQKTGAVTLPRNGGVRMSFDDPRELPGGFLTRYFSGNLPVVYLKNDGSFVELLTAPAARTVTGYAVDRTAGNALVWVEATGLAPSTNPVLYTSPFAATASGLAPRRVTAFDDPRGHGGGYMIAAHGMALQVVSATRALLTRLADGTSWNIDPEPGMAFANPLWVDDQDVWLDTGKLSTDGTAIIKGETILRIARTSLGAAISAK